MDWTSYDAALFDLDGVLTPTAAVHMQAWSEMFNDFLETQEGQEPYTERDYFAYVDGKPRYDGVRSFLTSRGIELPEGDPSDSPDAETVCGLGNRKNELFQKTLRDDGVEVFAGSRRYLEAVAAAGLGVGVVSSSANTRDVLEVTGLLGDLGV